MIHHLHCPICKNESVRIHFPVLDNSVTGECFPVWQCSNCTGMFTQDIPDEESIGRYYASEAYVSHTDTKKGIVNRLYHIVRSFTIKGKCKWVEQATSLKTGSILDIGCGTGTFLDGMKSAGWKVTGIEPDPVARENAKKNYGIEALAPEALDNLPNASFQAITMWHVLEHVHTLHPYLDKIKKLLAPGGRLFIAVPNYTSFDAGYYKETWAAYDVPRHLYHFSPNSMQILLNQQGFAMKGIKRMWFDSYYVSMLSEQYRKGVLKIFRAIFIAKISNIIALFNKRKCSSVVYIAAVD